MCQQQPEGYESQPGEEVANAGFRKRNGMYEGKMKG